MNALMRERLWPVAAFAGLALSLALQANALVLPRGGGAGASIRGSPHETPEGTAHSWGKTNPFRPQRPLEPELLRRSGHEDLREGALAEELSPRQASGVPHEASPWQDAPNLRVRLTGVKRIDRALLARLERELAKEIDPSRMGVVSLADDVPTDRLLSIQLSPAARVQGQLFEQLLRRTPDALHAGRLAAALQRHRGHLLIMVAHIDAQRPVIVFRGAHGQMRELPLDALREAEKMADVDILLIGCGSARHRAAGFADTLNSLDAAGAVLRAMAAKPTTFRALFETVAAPDFEMLIDPAKFKANGALAFARAGSSEPIAQVYWHGGSMPNEETVIPDTTADSNGVGNGTGVATARAVIAGAVLLSWLAGMALGWRKNAGVRFRAAAIQGIWHVFGAAVLVGAFAEVVIDELGVWWVIGGSLALLAIARTLWPARTCKPDDMRLVNALNGVRVVAVALPFVLVALLHLGLKLPPFVHAALAAGYGAGRTAPDPLISLVIAFVLSVVFKAFRTRIKISADIAEARAELLACGVSRSAKVEAALHGSRALAWELDMLDAGEVREAKVQQVAEMIAPDDWVDGQSSRFRLLHLTFTAVPTGAVWPLGNSGQLGLSGVFCVARAGSQFMHTLPHALTEMWQRGEIGVAALPRLLAMVERRLKPGDYLGVRGVHTRRYVRITLWVMLVWGLLAPILVAWALSGESDVRFLILVSFLAVEIPCGLLLITSVCWLMHERHLRRALLDACSDESSVRTTQSN